MNNTTVLKTGKSFNQLSNQWYLKPRNEDVKLFSVGSHMPATAAQAITIIGYGDAGKNNLPVRSLDYCVKCDNYNDFTACIEIINSYNEFDAALITKKAFWKLNLKHFLNDNNGNNGKDLFNFWIGRESSPAFYVSYNGKYGNKQIKDTEESEDAENPGTFIFWEEYTETQFREDMATLATEIKADEFSIETEYTYETGENSLKARFWFD